MADSPSTDNYTLGKGKVYLALLDPTLGVYKGYRHVGNCPDLTLTIDLSKLPHYSSMSGIRGKDQEIIPEINLISRPLF